MPTLDKFNKTTLEVKVIPRQKGMKDKDQEFYWDARQPGFGIKVSARKAVYVAQAKQEDGKTIREIIGEYRDIDVDVARDKAREAIKKIQTRQARKDGEQEHLTLEKVLTDYLTENNGRLRPKTQDVYSKAVHRCFPDWLDVPLNEIDDDMVAAKQLDLSQHKGRRSNSDGAKAQANQAMRVFRTLHNFAKLRYKDANKQPLVTTNNPVQTLKPRRLWNKPVSRKDFIDDDDLAVWYQAVMALENETIRDYFVLCLFTGLRRGEAAKVVWDNVKSQGKKPTLRIPAVDTKTNSEHVIPLPGFVAAMFERRRSACKVHSIAPGTDYVFPGEKPGAHIVEPKRAVARVIETTKKLRDDGTYVDFSMHDLRRTFGTIAGRLDIGYYKHKMLMNHSVQNDVTGAHYVELNVEDLREPMTKICNHICRAAGIAQVEAESAAQ